VGPEGRSFVLCRSVERLAKEQAMHELFAQGIVVEGPVDLIWTEVWGPAAI
jgi:hypothetical protein